MRFCTCLRCVILRYRAVRIFGVNTDYPSAALTRAVSENA